MKSMRESEASDFFGFDPGGKGRFGVAWLRGHEIRVETVGSVKAAVKWAEDVCEGRPLAAGIDTLLHWSVGDGGNREAERYLRKYLRSGVLSPNSLLGAMTIGGVTLALKLRDRWPSIELNETHPKALYSWFTGCAYRHNPQGAIAWLKARYVIDTVSLNDHEFDALLSALATREALRDDWCDLAKTHDDHVYMVCSVKYLWPCTTPMAVCKHEGRRTRQA
jgi:hypothetical protein